MAEIPLLTHHRNPPVLLMSLVVGSVLAATEVEGRPGKRLSYGTEILLRRVIGVTDLAGESRSK
jgi:hypothetical protein